jgi:hypothetical protein
MYCGQCGAKLGETDKACTGCGHKALTSFLGRRGNVLVVPRGVDKLPPACVKCGADRELTALKRTYYWHHPALYVLLLSPLIYAIVALIVRQRIKLEISLCRRHRTRRSRLLWSGLAVLLLSIPLGVAIGKLGAGDFAIALGVLVGALSFLAALVLLVIGSQTMSPQRIDDREATFKGVAESFLERLQRGPAGATAS